ncbi:L-arabinose isomerase [Paxillus involutus ATCC 200175]|uniref:Unplaced genomic scaffold PAXINscaffold_43, whole genome shotgun sequence n=1 Tax=Paxillus involutus ATCC 200175 TaxID=664439 RepID=A0A0C9STV0_PAXIN|nr:L-arabinose isomerase [Paxillus involutus ATCC 200175]
MSKSSADTERIVHAERKEATESQPTSISDLNARLENPLRDIPHDRLLGDVEVFANEKSLLHILPELKKGALLAQDGNCYTQVDGFSEDEKRVLAEEVSNKWRQTGTLYQMVVMTSLAAAVQGMDEAVINGAQIIYPRQFGLGDPTSQRDSWLIGLINSAPYLCCATISCWLTDPLNQRLGRKKTIFITCMISFLTCIWSALTNTWWHLFIARFFLGFGIGPKSATVPVYTAECSPAPIRGALVMMWQMWTAFGICLGDLIDLCFYFIPDTPHVTGLNWRLMLGSAGIPGLVVCLLVLFAPESPRWLISKGRYEDAYKQLCRLRLSPVQAARDLYYIHVLLQAENELKRGRNRIVEMFTVPRNRHAAIASWVVMFGQQFCGVNVIAYYSSNIFVASGFSQVAALASSLGWGTLNWLFALPAVFTIDTFGRRNLLLFTFPCMAICLLITGFSFWSTDPTGRLAGVSIGLYLFAVFYSPGAGPVPFTYSAEAFPLYVRELGMSFATATTWFWNFILAITFPSLLLAFKPQGAFAWYAAWCCILWFLVLLFVRETKGKTLEELDRVFEVPLRTHAAYGLAQVPWGIKKFVLLKNPKPLEVWRFGRGGEQGGEDEKGGMRGGMREDIGRV